MLKFIYTLFIGILYAVLIGVGIAAFYERPVFPQQSPETYAEKIPPCDNNTPESEQAQQERLETARKSQQEQNDYQKKVQVYSRNVSIISLVFAVAALIISLVLIKNLQLISDGLLLGGVFTELYSVIMGFETQDNKFRFVVVTIGFIISIIIGYIKFVKPTLVTQKTETPS